MVALSNGDGTFQQSKLATKNYTADQGWNSSNLYSRRVADVNGDGRADIVGFGSNKIFTSLAKEDGTFGNWVENWYSGMFTTSWGFNENNTPRDLADVNGDGKSDIIAFSSTGVTVALSRGDGHFDSAYHALSNFGILSGWQNQNTYTRKVGDVNGDGRADIVGFSSNKIYTSLAKEDGTYGDLVENWYGGRFTTSWGYNENNTPRELMDINGDGLADIVAFSYSGVDVALSRGDGYFDSAYRAMNDFGIGYGWNRQDTHARKMGDVNGDGKADIVGFKNNGAHIAIDSYKAYDNILDGGTGNDLINAGDGNDTVLGGEGSDDLNGGKGDDKINGEQGLDLLNGGEGNDSFDFSSLEDSSINAMDEIEDFEQGNDKINLSEIEEDLSFESFEFVVENGHTVIKDNSSDFAINLQGSFNLIEDDFIF